MYTVTSTEVAKKFGTVADIARREPVKVESHGRPQLVVLSFDEYERLRRLDRQALAATEMPPSLREATRAAMPSAQAAAYSDEA